MIARQLTITASSAELIATTGFGDPVEVQNLGTGTLWLGGDNTVDETNGFKVASGESKNLRYWSKVIWGYAETNNCDIRILEEKQG
jgi:hypothetical protein